MPEYRFFKKGPLLEGQLTIEEDEAHHLIHVMRMEPGDALELVNGQGALAKATVEKCGKKTALVKVQSVAQSDPPSFSTIIAQAIPRFSRLDILLEKGTELGMTELWLYPGERSEKERFTEHQKERMEKILISALKQCGALYLPSLVWMPPLSEWKEVKYPLFFGDLRSPPLAFWSAWQSQEPQEGAVFVVGPEKGFTEAEVKLLESWGAKGVSLGEHILRTETAPLAALSVMGQLQMVRHRKS